MPARLTLPRPLAAKSAQTASQAADNSSQPAASDSVTLSDAAKAYLAANAATETTTIATNARAWFDQQYQKLGLSSAMLDGQVAVDLTSQSRAALSAVASNSQSLFSKDESAAAAQALQGRFDDAMTPHVVIARHTGNYVELYQAAAAYLDEAGTDERATARWQGQKEAVIAGLDAAESESAGRRIRITPTIRSARCSTKHPRAMPRRRSPTPRALPARRARC